MVRKTRTRTTVMRVLAVSLLFTLCSSCQRLTSRFRDNPDQLVVFSIDGPSYFKNEGELTEEQAKGELFHRYPVLGKTEITDLQQQQAIISAINEAIGTPPDVYPKCFIPRHAIRHVKGSRTTEMLICFKCRNYVLFINGKEQSGTRSLGGLDSPKELLNRALTDAGIPPAKSN